MLSSNPTAEERFQYEAWLKEANTAYHALMTGQSEVSISADGESVTYRGSNKAQLQSYINDLRRVLGFSVTVNRGFAFKPIVFGRR